MTSNSLARGRDIDTVRSYLPLVSLGSLNDLDTILERERGREGNYALQQRSFKKRAGTSFSQEVSSKVGTLENLGNFRDILLSLSSFGETTVRTDLGTRAR